ncbi:MAG: hypothetical protein M1834_006765 [Cirrosporium novae-zelandiae]|nr:MAG: hypothetical protein M1834_006765 [Cirrosporium novae-zelandiae]
MSGKKRIECYASFADFIASDVELSIFRRFDRLNARNLLYLQSELLEADNRLTELDEEDNDHQTDDILPSAKCWETLVARAGEFPAEGERMDLIQKTRRLMKEYQEALLLHSRILKLQEPSSRAFGAFSQWFEKSKPLAGYGRDLLKERHDFVALKAPEEQDRLYRIAQDIGERLQPGYHNSTSTEIKYYSERFVQKFIIGASIIIAALLLEGAIVTLYLIRTPRMRLGLIALFTALFAATVGLLTNAKRSEMFGATAAYAAVLVVFVSGSLG